MRLNVPYVSQLGDGATLPDDCGQASTLTLLLHYRRVTARVAVDMLSRDTYGKTTAPQLVSLASRYDLPMAYDTAQNPDRGLLAAFEAGHPVILLVNYADLGFPVHLVGGVNQGLHWLVGTGQDEDGNWIVNDPLWVGSQGAGLTLSPARLKAAYRRYRVFHQDAKPLLAGA
ncbi:MAG TPA: hypothetical protein PKD09_09510 [Aggregatilinea sp.]|uniref:hypothetical protein n=1 Tax=Aggregatilinea sp. TaxID=2806333 RepID=UPI002CAAB1B8|nr:hypothetical protein [Aggregatilinea sp.]HML21874.1 hypothetical protein [Aggregatilinea sp.]